MRETSRSTAADLPWKLIVTLSAIGLVRPLLSMFGVLDALGKPWSPVAVTVVLAVVWVAAVVAARVSEPVATLALAGVGYGVLALLLNIVGAATTDAEVAPPIGLAAMILGNGIYGAVLGLVALGLLRLRERARG